MGINQRQFLAVFAAFVFGTGVLSAAPRLRLVSSTVGPVSIAQGTNGTAQTVEIYNDADGSLSPKVSSSVAWINTSVGAQRTCSTRPGVCIPIAISFNASGLPAGTTTGIVTVADNDPLVVDAPQTITVTAAIGGTVPSSVDVYVAPGTSRDIPFQTNSQLAGVAKTTDGGQWLSLAVDGTGSFRFLFPYKLHLAPPSSFSGTYNGTVTTGGSSFAPDNKTIAVTMRVTTQPIAQASTDKVEVKLAQGAPPTSAVVALNNLGQGTLTVSSALGSGASWLKSDSYAGGAVLTFDAGTMVPGTYPATVTIASNAANGNQIVPIEFTVVGKGAPFIKPQGVVDNGTFGAGDAVARGDVMVVLGEQLSFDPLTLGSAPPLDTTVGGATVLVNGNKAPMYYSSYGQLAFQMPYQISNGTVVVQTQRDGQTSNSVSVAVVDRAPRLLLLRGGPYGAIQNASQGNTIPAPDGTFGDIATKPAKAGDTLVIYSIGLGPTNPAVVAGQPAPLARLTATSTVNFGGGIGGIVVVPDYAGLSPNYAGLYQVNVVVPSGLPKGVVNVTLGFSDSVSNSVQIYVQ